MIPQFPTKNEDGYKMTRFRFSTMVNDGGQETDQLNKLLSLGWEPFSVTENGYFITIWLKMPELIIYKPTP